MRRIVVAAFAIHALIHLLGVAKAFGFAELKEIPITIGPWQGVLWASAALLLLTTAWAANREVPWMWAIGLLALIVSQLAIFTAWREASAGTLVNALLFLAVLNAWRRPAADRLDRAYATAVATATPARLEAPLITEADLTPLPELVRRYVRVTGSIGKPRVVNFRAVTRGGIRAHPTDGWMPYLAEQLNTLDVSRRLYLMHARKAAVPVSVFHRYVGARATMQVRAIDLVTIVDAAGPEMDKSETVTLFNDRSIFAPASLIDPAISWTEVDSHVVRGTWTNGPHTVTAFMKFASSGELIDWWSDDRSALSADGTSSERMRWSTPVGAYKEFNGRRLASQGEAVWHAPSGNYTYLTVEIDEVEVNVTDAGTAQAVRLDPGPRMAVAR
jgi:hypothetical protein